MLSIVLTGFQLALPAFVLYWLVTCRYWPGTCCFVGWSMSPWGQYCTSHVVNTLKHRYSCTVKYNTFNKNTAKDKLMPVGCNKFVNTNVSPFGNYLMIECYFCEVYWEVLYDHFDIISVGESRYQGYMKMVIS